MFNKTQVLEAIRWAILGRLLAQIITWSVSLIVLRYIAPESYGSFIVVQLIISLLMMLGICGFDKVIIQSKQLSHSQLRQILFIMFALCGFFVIGLFNASDYIAQFYAYTDMQDKIIYLSFALLLTPWISIAEASLDKELRFKEKAKGSLVVAVVCSLVTLLLVINNFGIWSLVISFLLQRACLCLYYCYLANTPIIPNFSISNMRSISYVGGLFLLGDIMWLLTQSVDGLLGAKWYGVEIYGFYALAVHLSSLILNKMMPIFNQTMMAFVSKIQNQEDKIAASLQKVLGLSLYLSIPIFWGLASIASALILTIFGETWQESALIMSILCVFIPIKINNSIVSMTLLGMGKAKLVMYIRLAVLLVLTVCLFVFSELSYLGLVYSVASSIIVHAAINVLLIRRTFNRAIVFPYKAILFGLLMALACVITGIACEALFLPVYINLVSQIIVGALCYISLMLSLEKDASQEIKSWFIQRKKIDV